MIKIQGLYNEALVYASLIEEKAREQIRMICDMEAYKDCKIRIMPDVHAGAGCTIGTTMTIKDAITPNMVGVDIGCGMETVRIREKEIDFEKLDRLIHEEIPAGMNIRGSIHENAFSVNVKDLRCLKQVKNLNKELLSIGTLGGGNHFIEADRDEEGNLYLVIHSGSRHLGKEVADIYQNLAYRQSNGLRKENIEEVIRDLKAQGREKEIEETVRKMKSQIQSLIPKELSYVKDELFEDYIHDMKIMQDFAMVNRKTMMEIILKGMGLTAVEQFTTIHNYIDTERKILRKGSVSAMENEKLLIPINMRDGSLICVGKGNEEWNCSAPHGAGRIMSRSEAFKNLSLEEYQKQMEGIYTSTANYSTLDESPMAYKDMKDIVEQITPTAKIINVIKPVYNFKAGE